MAAADRASGAAFAEKAAVDAKVVVTEAPKPLYDLRGGDQYVINGNTLCSVGFSVNNGGFVTAGHCGGTGSPTLGYNNVAQGTFASGATRSRPNFIVAWPKLLLCCGRPGRGSAGLSHERRVGTSSRYADLEAFGAGEVPTRRRNGRRASCLDALLDEHRGGLGGPAGSVPRPGSGAEVALEGLVVEAGSGAAADAGVSGAARATGNELVRMDFHDWSLGAAGWTRLREERSQWLLCFRVKCRSNHIRGAGRLPISTSPFEQTPGGLNQILSAARAPPFVPPIVAIVAGRRAVWCDAGIVGA